MNTALKIYFFTFLGLITNFTAQAYQPIIRPYQSARAAGMGNVRYTTGLFEENFYANPARVTANSENLFLLPKFTFEAGAGTLDTLSSLTGSGNSGLSAVSGAVGKPVSGRVQMVFPAYFNHEFLADFWAIGIGVVTSAQTAMMASSTGQIEPTTLINAGPSITIGRRLLEEHRLSVGLTVRSEFRASSGSAFSIRDFLTGSTDLAKTIKGGSGLGIDGDIGSTFRPHWGLLGFEYQVAFAINNLLGGEYTNLGGKISGWDRAPLKTPRTYNFGVSATKKEVAFFDSLTVALESTDWGANENGSIFRTLHIGSEGKWGVLALRAGFNQGYPSGGFGVDAGFFVLNLATYGEEFALNSGLMQDRRYSLEFGFQI